MQIYHVLHAVAASIVPPSDLRPVRLTCEYASNPLGVDTRRPRFGWELESAVRGQRQSAYQILVASSRDNLDANFGDKWDSGKVASDRSVNVVYEGNDLTSGETCYWKVFCWDRDGHPGGFSESASFEMGLLRDEDWQGDWIGADPSISAPLLRTEFPLDRPIRRARAYIAGLGWYELYLNGKRVGDHVLDPATTDYRKRVLYVSYDVTARLAPGENAVGVWLGNGWYSEPGWRRPYGDSPRLRMQLNVEHTDGSVTSIASDERWRVASSPILRNSLYGGETYDARLERPGWSCPGYDDSDWDRAVAKTAPGGRLVSQIMPPIKVCRPVQPVGLSYPQPGIAVYDLGQLFGGWVRLRLRGEQGTRVTIKYADRRSPDTGLVDQERWLHGWPAQETPETDVYVLKGEGEASYEPRFTYHPVRYVQIEGYPGKLTLDDLEGRVVHSAVDLSGDFECSNALVNQIHQCVLWTLTNGLFGIPLDCLHREHWAWTDPATITGMLYPRKHMPLFWIKWLNDIRDAQREDGAIPDVCPTYPGDRSDPAWGGNYPILAWYLYQYYDDRRILEGHYDAMVRWMDSLEEIAEEGIVTQGHYGDHMLPGDVPGEEEFISSETPPPLVWTGYYYRDAIVLSQVAATLGKPDEAASYAQLAEQLREAFNARWFDPAANQYATGSQTANLLPLILGIVPEGREESVLQNVVRDIVEKRDSHLHTGNTGTTCLIDLLAERGFGELLYRIVTNPTYPGWGYMVAQGATTIWESWGQGDSAESMIMWATVDEFFYNDLAGIRGPEYYAPETMSPGFRELEIRPHVLGDLTYARASIRTVYGMVASSWTRTEEVFRLEVRIPVNCRAKVRLPKLGGGHVRVLENGTPLWEAGTYRGGVPGVESGWEENETIAFQVGSGTYVFVVGTN